MTTDAPGSATIATASKSDAIVAFIDDQVQAFVTAKFPSSAALQPELNAALDGAIGLAEKALIVYGISKLSAKVPTLKAFLATNGVTL